MAKAARNKKAPKKKVEKLHKYRYYIVNIKIRQVDTTDDLPPSEYARLFRDFYFSFTRGKSSKQKECILATQVQSSIDEEAVLSGQLYQMTNINNKRWFNKRKNEIDETFKIPAEYAANAVQAEYLFIPSIHRFAYRDTVADHIDPYAVKQYFTVALSRFLSTGYYVDIDVESDPATIERIFEAAEVRRLWVSINYSNNDFSKEMQEFIEEDMKDSNVGSFEITAVHRTGNSINLSTSRVLAGALESAGSNGEAEATIVDADGKTRKIKTEKAARKVTVEATKEGKVISLFRKIRDEFRAN